MKKKSLYVLSVIRPRAHRDYKKGHYVKDGRGNIECRVERIGVYGSVEKAEDAIRKTVATEEAERKKYDIWEKSFGFVLDEVYLDDGLDKNGYPAQFESRRTYLNDGTPNCFSDLDWRCSKKFKGRTSPQHIKESMSAKEYRDFRKNGIFAYEWNDERITPIILTEFSPTAKEWKAKMKPGVYGDVTDDSGVAYDQSGGHHHPFSPDIFPVSALAYAGIAEKLAEKLRKSRDGGF